MILWLKAKIKPFLKLIFVLGMAFLVVWLLDIGCVFRWITGIPCPGCGMTRAHLAVLHLDFKEAFYWHPLWPLPVPLFLCVSFVPERFMSRRWVRNLTVVLLVVVIAVYVLRMALFFPDTPPMDYRKNSLLYRLFSWIRQSF